MTEIDMARQHGHNMEVEFVDNKDAFNIGYKSFLAGLKAGRPKWHDLRKNRNDIPPLDKDCERTSIKVVDDYGRVITYDYGSERWRDYEGDSLGLQPDFWCEIPTFTDKE